ncbi:Arginine/ornithine antiporter ArcD [Candidatus Rhodobacter oscarellae]|uniref:Probable membrane transporter protein n=1 Tax=Candidatus Rhodobacter oscarellae TaxID=1675527 RepID=A0A0J9E384_9RHOB|nr:sulfite exporter TauE/SafE family protein [Candidatus Rhodobacter lobularis]KMW57142.1 Arginine/ornithine antiporter ArcD [Candidatus Rhodobacter lobularis]
MTAEMLLLVTGALAAGFVNGLAGFGTALFSLGFWLQIYPPREAVALSVATALVTGLQGLWIVRREIRATRRRLARFLLPALLGIPLGAAALGWIEPRPLKLVIGGFMVIYGVFFLLRRRLPRFERPTPWADAGVGFAGGVLGGLAGLSGALPAMWCALRPWPRHETRAVMQPFNVAVLAITTVAFAVQGAYAPLATPLLVVIGCALVAAQVGIATFQRLSDVAFRWLVIGLMLVSGLVLLGRELL